MFICAALDNYNDNLGLDEVYTDQRKEILLILVDLQLVKTYMLKEIFFLSLSVKGLKITHCQGKN